MKLKALELALTEALQEREMLGQAKGRAEGRAEGRLHATRDDIARLLKRRFGRVTTPIQTAIDATADLDRLWAFFDRAVEVNSLEKLEDDLWMSAQAFERAFGKKPEEMEASVVEWPEAWKREFLGKLRRQADYLAEVEIGRLRATRWAILHILEERFEALTGAIQTTVDAIADVDRLGTLFERAVQVDSLEAFERELA